MAAPASAAMLAHGGSKLIPFAASAVLAALSLWWALSCLGRPRPHNQSTVGYLTPALLCIGTSALFGLQLASVLVAHLQSIAPLGAVHAP